MEFHVFGFRCGVTQERIGIGGYLEGKTSSKLQRAYLGLSHQ